MNLEETTQLIEALKKSDTLISYMNRYKDQLTTLTFIDYLNDKFQESGLKKSEVIRSINLSRSYAYDVFSGKKKPSRDKVIMLSFGLHLDYDATQKLLIVATHNPLHPKNKRDAILIFCKYNNYSFIDVNMLLFDYAELILE